MRRPTVASCYQRVRSYGPSFRLSLSSGSSLLRFAAPLTIQQFYAASTSKGSLEDLGLHRESLEHIGKQLGVQKLPDWYSITSEDVKLKGGWKLLSRAGNLPKLLQAIYPEFAWNEEAFTDGESRPPGYWKDVRNQKACLEKLAAELGFVQLSEWYDLTPSEVKKRVGLGLLKGRTLEEVLRAVYPDYGWDSSKFKEDTTVNGYWKDKKNLQNVLDTVEKQMGILQPEDWYSVRLTDLTELGFPFGVRKTQLIGLLEERYPDRKWDPVRLLRGRFAQQKRLERAVASLFQDVDIKINARKEANIIDPETQTPLELDIWIPSLNIAFEYQERHHYITSDYTYVPIEKLNKKDALKRQLLEERGMSLIVVPCWWDGTTESLVATIRKSRPDLLTDAASVDTTGVPIPETSPPGFFERQKFDVQDIGEPSLACFFTLSSVDPVNWWMFEKYDGLRGFWNPNRRAFLSRFGNQFSKFPQEIIDSMPDMFLDGEIWFGRDNFQEAMKVAHRSKQVQINWSQFKYMVYDVPNHQGTYEERYNLLLAKFGEGQNPFIEVAKREVCRDIQHMESFFQDVVDEGGEGIILRDPAAPFQRGRSPGYLKHKKFRDAEARVINAVGNQQWECELPNGVTFVASPGTTEFAKRWELKTGDIVSFKHRGFLESSKKPKFPAIYRLRDDLVWDNVVKNWKGDGKISTASTVNRTINKPRQYWQNVANRKAFLLHLAKDMGFDPMVPENWNNVTTQDIISRGGRGLFNYNQRAAIKLSQILADTFPELADYFAATNNQRRWATKNVNLLSVQGAFGSLSFKA